MTLSVPGPTWSPSYFLPLQQGSTILGIQYVICGRPLIPGFGLLSVFKDFPGGSDGQVSAYNAGDPGSIPGSGRSPGEGNGNPLQCSCSENPMNGGAWWLQSMGSQRVGHD